MALQTLDWLVVIAYVVLALGVGLVYAKRAGKDVDEFFLAGRTLPWWVAGTSMVATTFAADTPLVVTGWLRDHGIWKNWLWWCYAVGGMFTVFLFARYWRRGRVMTVAELAELRYGGKDAETLRGFLGIVHAAFFNTIILCWVILAGATIAEVVFGWDKLTAVVVAGLIALTYSLLAGFWGVVLTDMLQFVMAMVGATFLAGIAWNEVGGIEGVRAVVGPDGWNPEVLSFVPQAGAGMPWQASFWTTSVAVFCVYLGVQWWGSHGVDGGPTVVQRIAATRSDRDGVLAVLWYSIANYALRPWPWFMVALASLVVLPHIELTAPVQGAVTQVADGRIEVTAIEGDLPEGTLDEDALLALTGARHEVTWDLQDAAGEPVTWFPFSEVSVGDVVEAEAVVAKTNSERAYPVMMVDFLPIGLLGLMVASLIAAFMSTIDTHVNLASSYFVNDLYRRFWAPDRAPGHYVLVARISSAVVLAVACGFAFVSDHIGDLFTFFLAFLAGVGPIYVLRWLWWRVRASTEIAAMVASMLAAVVLTYAPITWHLGPLSPDGELTDGGRLVLTVMFSAMVSLFSLAFTAPPDPRDLVEFYRRVRPMGLWRPVRHHCKDIVPPRELAPVLAGVLGGLCAIYGLLFAIGHALFGRTGETLVAGAFVVGGAGLLTWALPRIGYARRG